jgi:Fe(3+) dicitrate transport protein
MKTKFNTRQTTPCRSFLLAALGTAILFLGLNQPAAATGAASPSTNAMPMADEMLVLPAMSIIGSKENVERLPGSGVFLDATDIRAFAYDDINQVIRRTPGVYVRQEDGYGLFPNVSLRGVSTTRNSKITVMEDGILMAPAPYSDPAAYYTPNIGRMSGLEVLKGSSQIKFGPETTGGVINYLATTIPAQNSGYLSASYGTDNDVRLHAWYGGRFEASWATVGFLVENVHRRTDGFKTIDATAGGGYLGSNDTGFDRNEPLARLRFDFRSSVRQSLEFAYGRTEIHADETYLGLTDADFRANPFRRYAASRFDAIDTEQERYSARYVIQPADFLNLRLTAYKTQFARNWYKLDAAGEGATGAFRNLGEALAGQFGENILDVLRGDAAGRLRVRANNRTYASEGLDALAVWHLDTGALSHRVETGARWHNDYADRFQWDDLYTQAADGSAIRTTAGVPGTQDNRRGESDALALYVQDRITVGGFTLTPGVRFEQIKYKDIRRSTATDTLSRITSERSKIIDYFAPGLGATWRQSEGFTWLASVHRGISPPGTGSVGNTLEEETSLGFEAGLRYNNRRDFSAEAIVFHTAFDNLIVEQNAGGGGGAGQTSNIGEVDTTGLELSLAYDPSRRLGWSLRNPWTLNVTWTRARLGNDVNAVGNGGSIAESIFSGGRKGNALPYIPDFQVALGTRFEFGRWGLHLDGYFQPRTWASANNSPARVNPDASPAPGFQPTADSRYGRVDAFLLIDASVHYPLSDRARVKLSCTNLLDWEYIASRVPVGPRPGAPRTLMVGFETRF